MGALHCPGKYSAHILLPRFCGARCGRAEHRDAAGTRSWIHHQEDEVWRSVHSKRWGSTARAKDHSCRMEEFVNDYENYSYYFEYGDFEDTGKQRYVQKETLHIISVVIYSISFVLGIIGNGIVIWLTACKSKPTVNTIWLLNLAVADLVFVVFLPISIDYVLRDFHWDFGIVMCKLNSFVLVMNMYSSVLFLAVLSLDRYISLVHVDWSQKHRKVRHSWVVCLVVWIIAIILSIPTLIFRDTLKLQNKVVCFTNFMGEEEHLAAMHRHITIVAVRTTVGFLLPFSTITVTGILLAVQVRRSKVIRMSSFSRTVSVIILAFFLCWAPYHIFSLMELSTYISSHLSNVLRVGFPLVTSLAFFNSCVNPLLYVLIGRKVRRLLIRSFLEITKKSLQELSQSISTTQSIAASASAVEPIELSTV
ncbi:G-protein coupled receptor 1 [Arapaima gigas]